MPRPLHIVEPTLEDAHGHCRSLLAAFCTAAAGHPVRLWASTRARPDVLDVPGVTVTPHFHRRIRLPEAFFLARRLLRRGEHVWFPTAGRTDIQLVDRALGRSADTSQAVLYVHWLGPVPSRLRRLRAVARRRPDLHLLAATPGVRAVLQTAGFENVDVVPYPLTARLRTNAGRPAFRRLLYAGSARGDKGFHHVVNLLRMLRERSSSVPAVVQTGGDYFGRLMHGVDEDIRRLTALRYHGLVVLGGSLDPEAYEDLFDGAICLQLYSPLGFADRVSGVTLDAFAVGAPVLTFAGTWIARQVGRFGAGIAVDPDRPDTWPDAVGRLVSDYATFAASARTAGRVLADEHDPRRLVEAVIDG